jgi:lysophospholipase L1-like esterase
VASNSGAHRLVVACIAAVLGGVFGAFAYRVIINYRTEHAAAARMAELDSYKGQAYAVLLGDSLTERAPAISSCGPVANFGVSGDQSSDVTARLDRAIALRPKVAVVLIGTNDIVHSIPPSETAERLASMARRLQSAGISVVVILPPRMDRKDAEPTRNAIAGRLAEVPGVRVLDLSISQADLDEDGVHLRRSGYDKWRRTLSKVLRCE